MRTFEGKKTISLGKIYRAKPKPQPIKGAWVLRHPDLHEDVFRITVYEENGIVTALIGYILP